MHDDPLPGSPPRRALVTTADSLTADILVKTLRIAGFEASVAEGIGQLLGAMERAQAPIELITSDIHLADGDIVQLIDALAGQSYAGHLILTSQQARSSLDPVTELAQSKGMTVIGCYEPPTPLQSLLDTIRSRVVRKSAPVAASKARISAAGLAADFHDWEVRAVFQPKVSLEDGRVTGFEALARWDHPEHGLLAPPHFLSLVAEANLIHEMTEAVLVQSLEALVACQRLVPRATMSVNLSGESLGRSGLPDRFRQLVDAQQVRPANMIFEVTESELLGSDTAALANAHRLGLMGFGLSLDDYGTGYSSLSRLKSLPFSELKVDRRFCHGAAERIQLRHILRSCVQLARDLGLKVIAEGVETRADRDLVRDLGFDAVQGFFDSPPLPQDELLRWLEDRETL